MDNPVSGANACVQRCLNRIDSFQAPKVPNKVLAMAALSVNLAFVWVIAEMSGSEDSKTVAKSLKRDFQYLENAVCGTPFHEYNESVIPSIVYDGVDVCNGLSSILDSNLPVFTTDDDESCEVEKDVQVWAYVSGVKEHILAEGAKVQTKCDDVKNYGAPAIFLDWRDHLVAISVNVTGVVYPEHRLAANGIDPAPFANLVDWLQVEGDKLTLQGCTAYREGKMGFV